MINAMKDKGSERNFHFTKVAATLVLKNPQAEIRASVFSEHNWRDYEAHERMVPMYPIKPDYIADQVGAWPFQIVSHHTMGIPRMKVSLVFYPVFSASGIYVPGSTLFDKAIVDYVKKKVLLLRSKPTEE